MKNLVIFALIVAGIYFVVPGNTSVEVKPVVAQSEAPIRYHQDAELVGYMSALGLDYSKLNLYYTDNPAFPGYKQASYTQPNNVYLSPEFDKDLINDALSHEYIHYVESKDNSVSEFKEEMTHLYNTALYQRMAFYRTDYCPNKSCLSIESEAKAYSCTELADSLLSQEFIDWCNHALPKRALLFN